MIKNLFAKQSAAVVGPIISVTFPGLQLAAAIAAKVDTGAYSGALHATNIREVSGSSGQKWLEFTPLASSNSVKLESYRKKIVRSSNGQSEQRFVIDTEIAIAGAIYPISISLANRSKLKYPVLIGSKFLQTHSFLIDLKHST